MEFVSTGLLEWAAASRSVGSPHESGDVCLVRVLPPVASIVVVDGLGVRAPIGPGTTGIVEFVADSPGSWPVRLDPSGTRIGTVEVQG